MPFREIPDPAQVAVLTAVLDDVCSVAGIEPDSPEREDAACLIARLFWEGNRSAEELRAAVACRLEREERLYG